MVRMVSSVYLPYSIVQPSKASQGVACGLKQTWYCQAEWLLWQPMKRLECLFCVSMAQRDAKLRIVKLHA
jgi:hypothetical protein